jgi:hypothetical protein
VRDSGLAPLQSATGTTAAGTASTTGNRYDDGWPDNGSWSLPSQPTLGSAAGSTAATRTGTSGSPNSTPATNSNQPSGQFASQSGFPAASGQTTGVINTAAANSDTSGTAAAGHLPQIGRNSTTSTAAATTNAPQPWMLLIASVLTLAGSLAANLYLGVSYLDARQKYQSLVRKTAETFRRVKAAAA